MKKILLLLLLALSANAGPKKGTIEWQEWRDSLRTIEQLKYNHSKVKQVGDQMPKVEGDYISYIFMYGLNKETNLKRKFGVIFGYDADGDKKTDYEFLVRDCDRGGRNKIIATYDAHHNKLYLDYNRDLIIDEVVDYDTLEDRILPEIPIKCARRII